MTDLRPRGGAPGAVRTAIRSALLLGLVASTAAFGPAPDPAPAPASAVVVAGARLYVDPSSPARRQADEWRRSRPADAALLERIAAMPTAVWMGDWNRDVRGDVSRVMQAAAGQRALPVLVAYNIPNRDCGQHSAGGAGGADGYRRWIRAFGEGLAGRGAIVILEPDALALTDCLSPQARDERFALLREAVQVLEARGAAVYLDAGHARWVPADDMARRLHAAGIAQAHGFALNVSNFHPTADNVAYGERVSALAGGSRFVVDTSRNGLGSPGADQWCNPQGRALGAAPTTRTGHRLVDAYLWVKRPGESDGSCNGGPAAGAWWAEYALGLARRQPGAVASR